MDITSYLQERQNFWDSRAAEKHPRGLGSYYHQRLIHLYSHAVPSNLRVLELGCGRGDLLSALKPSYGVGIDLSPQIIAQAQQKHPHLHFLAADAHHPPLNETFDIIILSDLLGELWDIQLLLQNIHHLTHPHSLILFNFYSRLWELPLKIARNTGLAEPLLQQNWLTVEDLDNLLLLTNYQRVKHSREIIWPLRTPLIDTLLNRYLGRLWPLHHLAATNFIIARPLHSSQPSSSTLPSSSTPTSSPATTTRPTDVKVSVIVPARNEAGNIANLIQRVPNMGAGTEIIFVEGHSSDSTYQTIEQLLQKPTPLPCRLFQQTGKGKGDAVRLGFQHATGDILMILDADLTVTPEDLPRFYHALLHQHAQFANGVRLVYPMEGQAMRFLNLLGNKFFALGFSWLLGQSLKDTLCGTKVLWKTDYLRIQEGRSYFGNFDPFGDFDLLFGAAKLNLAIRDIPIRYRNRTYGSTNIHRFRHGMLLLRMLAFAARRLKFI